MKENIKTTHYANGTGIPLITGTNNWDALTDTNKAYCWYNNDTANKARYATLYTWAAAMNGSASDITNPSGVKGLCQAGWHLPSDAEWTQMENYLADNGYNYDGTIGGGSTKIAKALVSISGWNSTSTFGAVGNIDYSLCRNKSGFTAFPGGHRFKDVYFLMDGASSYWWSATEDYPTYATSRVVK